MDVTAECDWTRTVIACFILTMTVSSLAQTFPVTAHETDVSPRNTLATLASGRTQPLKTSRDGSIRYISTVGNQNILCNSLEAQNIGRSYAQRVETTSKLITDAVIAEYVNHIGQNLVHTSDTQVQVNLRIIDTAKVNAFSLPGGFIFIDSGLILAAANEAELAGVISHEIAHVAACHAEQETVRTELANLGSMPLIFRFVVRPFTLNTIYLNPTRSFESEADFLGVEYLYKAGYDPHALVSILEKVNAIKKQKAVNGVSDFESGSLTHRIASTRRKLNARMLPAQEYKVDTSDFQRIKERLSQLDKPR